MLLRALAVLVAAVLSLGGLTVAPGSAGALPPPAPTELRVVDALPSSGVRALIAAVDDHDDGHDGHGHGHDGHDDDHDDGHDGHDDDGHDDHGHDGHDDHQGDADHGVAQAGAFVAAAVSEMVRAPIPFSMVGFAAASDALVEVRTSADGQDWGPWRRSEALNPDEGPTGAIGRLAADGRHPTEGVWVGQARWLQIRVAGASPEQVRATLIDSMGLSRSLPGRALDAVRAAWRGGAPAAAGAKAPTIVTRAQWGAEESRRKGSPSYARRVRAGIIHHTVHSNTYTQSEAPGLVRAIYRYHTGSLGWSDIGYNLLVDRFGTVYEGRAGGVDRAVIGAHAGGFNTGTFGVASIGTHSAAGPSSATLESIARVVAWKFDIHHLDVTGSRELRSGGSTRYPAGQTVRLPTLMGHRAVSATACPGNSLDGLLPALRHRVLELGGSMILDHEGEPNRVTVARGQPLGAPVRFSARLRPAGPWALEVRSPEGRVVHRDEGSGDAVSSTWSPMGALLGRYDWTITSEGRTPASDWVDLVPPVIRDVTVPPLARGGRDAGFTAPVRFRAALWPQAAWTLTVTGPSGVVHTAPGMGDALDVSWSGRAGLQPGAYTWRITADDAEPASGEIELLWPVLARTGDVADAPGRSISVARSAFPEAGGAQIAVLSRADLFADAMAGGPLAGARGPILLTPSDRLDTRVRAELERVLPAGRTVYLLGGSSALRPAVAEALAERWTVVRLAGTGRAETAARVADVVVDGRRGGPVLVARAGPDSASPWADALAGGAYGASAGVPVLLTDGDRLSPAARDAIRRHGFDRAIVLGGSSAIADAVVAELPRPERVAGRDRSETAAAVAERLWGRTAARDGDRFTVTNGFTADAWALALTAAPLAARRQAPLLLTDAALPPGTAAYLDRLGYSPQRLAGGWVLGGESVVNRAVEDELLRRLQ